MLFLVLGSCELALERLGHLWRWRAGKTEPDLDTVVDEPLGGSEGTDHDDPGHKSLPDAHEAELLQSLAGSRSLGHVHLGDDSVGRVRDDGAEDTGNVTGSKSHHQLLALGALISWLRHNMPADKNCDLVTKPSFIYAKMSLYL